MLMSLFRKRPNARAGDALYASAAAQARMPAFYTTLGVADRIDARFELYTLHVLLLILRLRDESEAGVETAQALFDVYVSALDHVLRELGVGDISMAKKMRNLGEALYGRMTAYEAPLREGDADTLAVHFARNIYGDEGTEGAGPLARYAVAARTVLASQPFNEITRQPSWPEIAA